MAGPVLNTGDLFQARLNGLCNGQLIMNKFDWIVESMVGAPPDQQAFFSAFNVKHFIPAVGMWTRFLSCMPDNYSLERIDYQVVGPTRAIKFSIFPALLGTFGSDSATSNTAGVITKRGNAGRRDNISTTHLLTIDDGNAYQNGQLGAPIRALMASFATALLFPDFVLVGATTVNYHPCINRDNIPANSVPITNFLVQDTVRVMRRRTVGVGK